MPGIPKVKLPEDPAPLTADELESPRSAGLSSFTAISGLDGFSCGNPLEAIHNE